MTKMIEFLYAFFASQFAPLSEETSITKNVVRSMLFEQIDIATDLIALGYEQVHMDRKLSQLIADYDAKKGESYKFGTAQLLDISEKGEKGKESEVIHRGPGLPYRMAELAVCVIQEKMHQKESSKTGDARATHFPNPNAGKSIAFIEKEVPKKMPTRTSKKKKTEKPLQRQLEPEFNEPEALASQVESDIDDLFKEGFDSY